MARAITQMRDAIVLLGFSGVGKDTTFVELYSRYPDKFANVKFSSLAKAIVAKVLDCSLCDLEDKSFRNKDLGHWSGMTPMDLITVLYRGCTPESTKAHIKYALASYDCSRIPVFTDIRRLEEAKAVNECFSNPMYVYLWSNVVDGGVNDSEVEHVAFVNNAKVICRDGLTVTDVVNTIEDYLNED